MAGAGSGAHPPRVLGFTDLVLFYVVTGISLRWIATAAAAGPSAIVIWIGAMLCFFVPLACAVIELSSRYPQEGGLYIWTRQAFGPLAGFMAGWSYFTSNLPYFPAVFYFDAGNALFIGGESWRHLHDDPAYFMLFSLVALAAITALNIFGLRFAKWMNNVGAVGMWLPALIVIAMGALAWTRFGSATDFSATTMTPSVQIKDMLFWASLTFALSGCEAASFMSGEIKDARRTIPRALIVGGAIIVFCYVVGTVAVLVAMPASEVNTLQGLIQAGAATALKLNMAWVIVPLAILITIGNLGAASGFLGAAARIPFVIGIERSLPPVFGRVHPRWGTPYVALMLQGGLGALFVVLGQLGTGVKGAYDVLVSMGIIAAFIPFALVFLAVIRLQREPAGPEIWRLPGGRVSSTALACLGLVTTLAGILLASMPAADEPNKPLAVAKILGLTAMLLGIGWAIYAASRRRAAREAAFA
ncbi:APC family permease [Sphingomonas profundi]|uniref:APC family permease n=1 Tax=Alterirhizorhabdus profundi TaxID=2681549 RepID=UPI0012E7F6AB|nr:APC family permease [Sphingomonas profundi]